MSKRSLYIATFAVAGATFSWFLIILMMLGYSWALTRGWVELFTWIWNSRAHLLLISLAKLFVLFGAYLGYRGGIFFWPKLYDENGNVRFHDFKSFRAWRARMREAPSIDRSERV